MQCDKIDHIKGVVELCGIKGLKRFFDAAVHCEQSSNPWK